MNTAATLALQALQLYDVYTALPQDRGGPNGPKGRAHQAWLDAKAEAQASAEQALPTVDRALLEAENLRLREALDRQITVSDRLEGRLREIGKWLASSSSVGTVDAMPGSAGGFTMAVFKAGDVPVGTALYTHPASGSNLPPEK